MKTIRKSFCLALAALAAAFTARAVDPVAVWSGDFDVAEKSGLTLNLNGNTRAADNSYIEITGNNGVMVSGGNVNHSTVLIKYSNLDWSNAGSGKVISLLTHKCGAKTEANCSGIAVASDGVLHGIWVNNKWSTTTGGPLVAPNDASAKVSLACTFVSAAAAGDEGTRAFYKNESGVVSQVYNASGLKGTKDNTVTTDWSIGGHYGTSTGSSVKTSATGMKIYGIAIFDKWLTQAEVAAYSFPDPEARKDPYAPGETIVWSNTCSTAEVKASSATSRFNFMIPASDYLPAGSVVRIQRVRLASVNDTFNGWVARHSDAYFLCLNNVESAGVNGNGANGGFLADSNADAMIASNASTSDHALNFVFENACDIVVGTNYQAPSGNTWDTGFCLLANNHKLCYGSGDDYAGVRLVNTGDANSLVKTSKETTGYYPAYEITAVVVSNPLLSRDATIDGDETWSTLWEGEDAPVASTPINLTVSSNSTLTFDETTAFQSLKLIGSADLMIDGITSANVGLITKINTSAFTGKLRLEIDASAGLTADATFRNYIRTASDKVTFVFKSTVANKGATLDYGVAVNAAIHSHIVFNGGTHVMKYGYGGSGADGNLFGVNGTGDKPTVLVTGNATLNFTAKDISYWSGGSDIGGVIRVNEGATLNLLQNGSDTFFYRQRLWLDPGSLTTFNFNAKDQGAGMESCFRWQGGAVQNKEQIYVPASTTDMTSKPAVIKQLGTGSLHLASDATRGLAIFVGANSKLRMETPITAGANDATIIKYGTGVFETTSSIAVHPFTVTEGTFASSSTINKLTIGQDVAFDISEGAPTVTESFTAQSKVLKLTIAEPEHMMPVITLPAGTDKTGWTAIVNGNTANPCDLVADGNTLKLKWKIPPTITVDANDVTIKTADDWNGGVVTIGLVGLKAGDYEDDLRFLLRFGDKVVTGSAQDASASFNLAPSYFTAGNIYRGTFELEYGTSNEPIVAAEVTVYAGEKTYGTKEGWINETTKTFASTGSYDPEQGATFDDSFIKFSNPTDVVFTPTNSPADYVAKCDSDVTFAIFSGEEAIQDDDDFVADDLQAGVRIVDNGNGGVKFQFISGDAWVDGPMATLNKTYEVTVKFHYAKEEGDADSVTYTVGETVQSCARRANVAEKLETISFADGTQIASLTGNCQIEVANPVEKETGLAPGADGKELKATDEKAAQTEAEKIPVVVPSEVEGGLTEGLSADAAAAAKAAYTTNFTVVAQKNASGKFVAIVVPTADAETRAKQEAQRVSEGVLTEVTALVEGTEGTATVVKAVPGFFYGVAETNAVIHMQATEPSEWKMAGASGKVELKVTKPANAKQRFYKIICSPLPKK